MGTTQSSSGLSQSNQEQGQEQNVAIIRPCASGVYVLTVDKQVSQGKQYIRIWDGMSKELLWTHIYCMEKLFRFCPQAGKLFAFCDDNGGCVKIYDIHLGNLRTIDNLGSTFVYTVSNSGTKVLTQVQKPVRSKNWISEVWNVEDVTKLYTFKRTDLCGARFSGNSERIVSLARDATIHVWDAATGSGILSFGAMQEDCVKYIEVSTNLCCTHYGLDLDVWELTTGKLILHCSFHVAIQAVCFGRDEECILVLTRSGEEQETICCWNLLDGTQRFSTTTSRRGLYTVAVSPSTGGFCMLSHVDGTVRHMDLITGEELSPCTEFDGSRYALFTEHSGNILM
jgi:WD40 repeat protein